VSLELHPDGLHGIFPSGQLSPTQTSGHGTAVASVAASRFCFN
jgi:hypothetical protein